MGMAVNLFEKITDDSSLDTTYLQFIIAQQSRELNVALGDDIIHIIAIYSITYNWHGRFKWLKTNDSNCPYSVFPIHADTVIPIKSIDFQEIYIVHCVAPRCYIYHPFKDTFYEFQSPQPTYSRESHCTLMSDGRIVSIGGSIKHLDIYDPRNGVWIKQNYHENIIDFGEKCVVVQDQLNSNIIHCVGGTNIVSNALHSMDIRNGFRCVERKQIYINRNNTNLMPLEKLSGHRVVMSDTNKMLLFGGRKLDGVYCVDLSENAMDDDSNCKIGKWMAGFDRALFGYDVTPDRKYLVIAGGYQYNTFQRRSTVNILDLCTVDEGIPPLSFMGNLRLKMPATLTSIGITTLDDTLHVFGGFDGHRNTNTHWVAKTREIVIGSDY